MARRDPIRIGIAHGRVWLGVLTACFAVCLAAAAQSRVQAEPQVQSGQAQEPQAASPVVLDRAVAVVNTHVILASDVGDEIRLSVLDPNSGGHIQLTQQQALEQLISRTLIEQQIRQEDMPAIEPSQQEVNARLNQLRSQLPVCVRQNCASDAGWNTFLKSHGLTPERVRSLSALPARDSALYRATIPAGHSNLRAADRNLLRRHAVAAIRARRNHSAAEPGGFAHSGDSAEQQVNMLFDNWLNNLRQQGDVEVLARSLPAPAPAAETPKPRAAPEKEAYERARNHAQVSGAVQSSRV